MDYRTLGHRAELIDISATLSFLSMDLSLNFFFVSSTLQNYAGCIHVQTLVVHFNYTKCGIGILQFDVCDPMVHGPRIPKNQTP